MRSHSPQVICHPENLRIEVYCIPWVIRMQDILLPNPEDAIPGRTNTGWASSEVIHARRLRALGVPKSNLGDRLQ
jgi:hypothetical protein